MDYISRLEKMDKHLQEHPRDYQTVIARLKLVSEAIDHERHKRASMRLKQLAEIKKKLREEDEAHGNK